MKKLQVLAIATISTSILLGSVAPAFAADVATPTTEGTVKFIAGNETEVDPPVETIPPVTIPPIEGGGDGPLKIMMVPTMDFGEHKISTADEVYPMIAEMQEKADNSGETPYVSFAQVSDLRGGAKGWTLNASMSHFIAGNGTNKVLDGAVIKLDQTSDKFVGNKPFYNSSIELKAPTGGATAGDTVKVMSAEKDKDQGADRTSIVWGDQKTIKESSYLDDDGIKVSGKYTNAAINLHVPGTTVKEAAQYTSTITWTLSDTPGE